LNKLNIELTLFEHFFQIQPTIPLRWKFGWSWMLTRFLPQQDSSTAVLLTIYL